MVLLFSTKQVSSNQLLYDVARHNFNTFDVKSFDLEQMSFGELGLIIIKGFNNQKELDRYRQILNTTSDFALPKQVRPVGISAKNFELLINEGRSFEEYFNFIGEETYIATEEEVLPPSEYGESEGIPSDEEIKEIEQQLDAPKESVEEEPTKETPTEVKEEVKEEPKEQPKTETPKAETPKKEEQKATTNKKDKKKNEKKNNNTTKQKINYPTGSEGDDPLLGTP